MKNDLAIFEGHQIRRHYDDKTETWWFSIVDIIRVLTQQPDFTTVEQAQGATSQGRQSVGDNLSPTENARR
jgi:hypothetical protein